MAIPQGRLQLQQLLGLLSGTKRSNERGSTDHEQPPIQTHIPSNPPSYSICVYTCIPLELVLCVSVSLHDTLVTRVVFSVLE